jgi:hypothetical protein
MSIHFTQGTTGNLKGPTTHTEPPLAPTDQARSAMMGTMGNLKGPSPPLIHHLPLRTERDFPLSEYLVVRYVCYFYAL